MRKLLLAAAAAVLLSTPTLAADLPVAAEPVAPAYLPFTWTGFYVGANVGAAFGDSDRDIKISEEPDPYEQYGNLGDDDVGLTAGVQAGYNYQMGMLVVGVEGDINYLGLDRSADYVDEDDNIFEVSNDINWFGTLRARLGVTPMDRLLVYATGGLAFGDIDEDATFFYEGEDYSGSNSDTQWGWTIGGGVEYALTDNWTIKAEYLFVDLDDSDFTVTSDAVPGTSFRVEGDNQFSVVRLGVNYKF
jgi:outer membrane immunogenic protein